MKKRFLIVALLFLPHSACTESLARALKVIGPEPTSPWLHNFRPAQEFTVVPNPELSNGQRLTFQAAISMANPGDLFWMAGGIYRGQFLLDKSGTPEQPIVFRSIPGQKVIIHGALEIKGAHTWIWGLEITDPGGISSRGSGVQLMAPGIHVINNVIHDQVDKNGIGAWNTGAGQVVYGNILYDNGEGPRHPHNIYAQNDFEQYGLKYFVNNVLLDSADVDPQSFNFHAYTENGLITGFHLQGNIIKNGRFLIGGFNAPADREVVIGNYFYDSTVQFGYRRPTQVEFHNNLVARGGLDILWFWGAGETQYAQTAPNVFTGNEILLPRDNHLQFRTSAYLAGGRCEGCPPIQASDVVDDNVYSAPFKGTFFANNDDRGTVRFGQWKAAASAAGNAFDANSTLMDAVSGSKIVLLRNEYEPSRGHLVVFNWDGAPQLAVDLSSVVPVGTAFDLYPAKADSGGPAISGVYKKPVEIPTRGEEFLVFVVTARE